MSPPKRTDCRLSLGGLIRSHGTVSEVCCKNCGDANVPCYRSRQHSPCCARCVEKGVRCIQSEANNTVSLDANIRRRHKNLVRGFRRLNQEFQEFSRLVETRDRRCASPESSSDDDADDDDDDDTVDEEETESSSPQSESSESTAVPTSPTSPPPAFHAEVATMVPPQPSIPDVVDYDPGWWSELNAEVDPSSVLSGFSLRNLYALDSFGGIL